MFDFGYDWIDFWFYGCWIVDWVLFCGWVWCCGMGVCGCYVCFGRYGLLFGVNLDFGWGWLYGVDYGWVVWWFYVIWGLWGDFVGVVVCVWCCWFYWLCLLIWNFFVWYWLVFGVLFWFWMLFWLFGEDWDGCCVWGL